MTEIESIKRFLQEIETYQSNHYGYYDRTLLVKTYQQLPNEIKQYLTPPKNLLKLLWRGCDGLSETRAISFTNSKSSASLFGVYIIPFSELVDYRGLIDTEKARKLNDKLKSPCDIGDDEGEVIVIQPKWNLSINLKQYFKA